MKDKDALRYECQRHLDRRPIRPQESGPAAWLVALMGIVGLALLGWVAFRLADRWLDW